MTFCDIALGLFVLFLCKSCVFKCESALSGGFRTTQIGPKPIWNDTHLDKLKADLLMNYDQYARPEHHANTTKVKISMSALYLDVEEAKSLLVLHTWLRLEWTDSKLKWNESKYGDLAVIRINDHEVWRPDIYLYNSAAPGDQLIRVASRNVLVYSTGEVIWVPPVKLTALCTYDLRYWPFDTQHCQINLGSWTHSDNEINLTIYQNYSSGDLEATIVCSSWKINTTAEIVTRTYACCQETYSSAIFNFTLTRKSSPYYAIIVTPAIVTTFFILTPFWLPPQAGEKIILNSFSLVLLSILLLYFNHQVAGVATETPLLVSFYSSSLYIVGFSLVVSMVCFTICKIKKRRPLPALVKILLQGSLGEWLLLDQYLKEVHDNPHDEDAQASTFECNDANEEQVTKSLIQHEWKVFIVAIDRLCFIIYFFVFIALAIAYL